VCCVDRVRRVGCNDTNMCRACRGVCRYREAAGEHGITGWFLGVPAWAEGYKKKRNNRVMKPRRKTKLCSNWLAARKEGSAPEGAPPWWGCPRGRDCEWAHGTSELRGDGKLAYEAEKKEKRQHATSSAYVVQRSFCVVVCSAVRPRCG